MTVVVSSWDIVGCDIVGAARGPRPRQRARRRSKYQWQPVLQCDNPPRQPLFPGPNGRGVQEVGLFPPASLRHNDCDISLTLLLRFPPPTSSLQCWIARSISRCPTFRADGRIYCPALLCQNWDCRQGADRVVLADRASSQGPGGEPGRHRRADNEPPGCDDVRPPLTQRRPMQKSANQLIIF